MFAGRNDFSLLGREFRMRAFYSGRAKTCGGGAVSAHLKKGALARRFSHCATHTHTHGEREENVLTKEQILKREAPVWESDPGR